MSNKEVLAQEIVYYESIGRISKAMDKFGQGLHALGVLQLIRTFPQLFAPLFMYTACISSDDVLETIYIDETMTELQPGDEILMAHLKKWISNASVEGEGVCTFIVKLTC